MMRKLQARRTYTGMSDQPKSTVGTFTKPATTFNGPPQNKKDIDVNVFNQRIQNYKAPANVTSAGTFSTSKPQQIQDGHSRVPMSGNANHMVDSHLDQMKDGPNYGKEFDEAVNDMNLRALRIPVTSDLKRVFIECRYAIGNGSLLRFFKDMETQKIGARSSSGHSAEPIGHLEGPLFKTGLDFYATIGSTIGQLTKVTIKFVPRAQVYGGIKTEKPVAIHVINCESNYIARRDAIKERYAQIALAMAVSLERAGYIKHSV